MPSPEKRNRISGNTYLTVAVLIWPFVWYGLHFHKLASTPSGRMAIIACRTAVRISGYTLVVVVHLGLIVMCMAINATEKRVIARVCMAVGTKGPFTGMMSGVDREILTIMVEGRGYPCSGGMAAFAIGRKLCRSMGWICSSSIVGLVTTITGIRGCGVITVVTLVAGDCYMCAGKGIISIVDGECSRCPAWICRVTCCTCGRDIGSNMIRICGGSIVSLVATDTGIRGCAIISVMTLVACGSGMSTGEGIVCIVDGECGRCPAWVCRVTCRTGGRDIGGSMIRICSGSIIGLVATDTGIRGCAVISVMALVARGGDVCAGEGIVSIVDGECGWCPTWICCMTCCTGVRDIRSNMIRIGSLVISGNMTS
jgi:hypothetical protein